jgi:hypothetical protein
MSVQIIKHKIDNTILFTLLEEICIKNNKYYTFNRDSYKKGVLMGLIPLFIDTLKPYYYISKRKY